jgi:poly(hydroxyalkanoate) depolymerase family esterase
MRMHPSIVEATRLTREGRLGDATALLREMLGRAVPAPPIAEPVVLQNQPARLPAPGGIPDARAAATGRHREPGSFETRVHVSPHGRITYKLYVPAAIAAGAPLIVMLHGCTQTADDFARGTGMNRLADETGLLVAYPEQPQSANPSRCWNWFRPGDQRRDAGEPALIAGLTREIVARHAIDPERVFVAGLSAGGAAAAIMGETYPDLYAAVGVHSGIACGAANDIAGAMMAMRRGGGKAATRPSSAFVPTITFHGDRDPTVNKVNSDEIIDRANRNGRAPLSAETLRGSTPSGRTYFRRIMRDEQGRSRLEQWTIHGAGHAWAGGDPAGSYVDSAGPDASKEMIRFFLDQSA